MWVQIWKYLFSSSVNHLFLYFKSSILWLVVDVLMPYKDILIAVFEKSTILICYV